jgi:hypothetical protein
MYVCIYDGDDDDDDGKGGGNTSRTEFEFKKHLNLFENYELYKYNNQISIR